MNQDNKSFLVCSKLEELPMKTKLIWAWEKFKGKSRVYVSVYFWNQMQVEIQCRQYGRNKFKVLDEFQ